MTTNKISFEKIKAISNEKRFKIIELTQNNKLSIRKISSLIGLAYTKCDDYITTLYKLELVSKEKQGKNVLVKSRVILSSNKIEFT